ncbi:uncharacterized protein LY89DRAFT_503857 [Mollisia scopiformis]|uniref:Uncharacterized protein n=1 Tax=Mollisia scopiformis TaxID=149040 RepID=A0A194XF14_MOLSC|nr:uncharacterized protein LY89DRAFT_503857 [Mollisia scopiformis]KUJ18741.1 hypothetical protein LY89DRAFT_503857 [Mollisia scopiformis]
MRASAGPRNPWCYTAQHSIKLKQRPDQNYISTTYPHLNKIPYQKNNKTLSSSFIPEGRLPFFCGQRHVGIERFGRTAHANWVGAPRSDCLSTAQARELQRRTGLNGLLREVRCVFAGCLLFERTELDQRAEKTTLHPSPPRPHTTEIVR